MTLTEQQMFDYIFCPAKYHMKHVMGYQIGDPISLPKLLNRVAKYFYINLLNGKVCSMNELKMKWDSICKQYPDFLDAKKNLTGMGLIVNLYRWAADEKICVGDVDEKYKLYLGDTEFVGNIDVILVRPDKKIELMYTNFNDREPEQFDIETKLKYTLDSVAFKTMHNRPVDGIRIHCVKSIKDHLAYRTEADADRLRTTILNVARGIENNIFYPREAGTCANCTGKELCRYWNCN